MERKMETQQNLPAEQANVGQHAAWIAGRIKTLLAHYFQTENPSELEEAAIDDWIETLLPFSQHAIQTACSEYLKTEPRRRPTPASILSLAQKAVEQAQAYKAKFHNDLSAEEAKVANFAQSKGWMSYEAAKDAICRARDLPQKPWITSPIDIALYAVRHSEANAVLVNGQAE